MVMKFNNFGDILDLLSALAFSMVSVKNKNSAHAH